MSEQIKIIFVRAKIKTRAKAKITKKNISKQDFVFFDIYDDEVRRTGKQIASKHKAQVGNHRCLRVCNRNVLLLPYLHI